ncbi:hypothetical protein NM208_g17224 [Fusarium decemcellulare]|uniref:Uncharacterized protein n=1 Tax=Fusarium decemcellulare TaxID=57161 RepID=A0ACC1RAJ0_9HYPO|nr:hypothetical protein NM208_g17224 [Fusarium decemcellulare]
MHHWIAAAQHPHGSLKKELRGSACFMLPPPVDRDLCDSSQIANFQVMLRLITGTRTTSGVALLLEVSTPLVPEAREEDLRQSRILASRRRPRNSWPLMREPRAEICFTNWQYPLLANTGNAIVLNGPFEDEFVAVVVFSELLFRVVALTLSKPPQPAVFAEPQSKEPRPRSGQLLADVAVYSSGPAPPSDVEPSCLAEDQLLPHQRFTVEQGQLCVPSYGPLSEPLARAADSTMRA